MSRRVESLILKVSRIASGAVLMALAAAAAGGFLIRPFWWRRHSRH
jgi:hypothetical protein